MGAWNLRALQILYSALKVPLLLAVSALLCIPSFWVVNTVLGLREDLGRATRGILAAQATLAVVLSALCPITAVANLSISDYDTVKLFNGVQFAIATIAGHIVLGRHYQPLIRRNPRHRAGKAVWLVLYVFVAIQMAWVLRPYIGTPDRPPEFFREDAWSNAYVHVLHLISRSFGAP